MHIPYQHQCGYLPDFVVTYQLLPLNLAGDLPIVYQGRRWDFMYDEKLYRDGFFGIYPEILIATTGEVFPSQQPIPLYGMATMWIANARLRPVHQQRISTGIRGYRMEANHKIVVCEVVRIVGLFDNPL